MSVIYPFRALRPTRERAAEVAAVPYDVVNTTEARALAENNQLSFLRVSRPEIELPDGTDIYSDEVYKKAAANFQRLIETAPLKQDDEPSLYLYKLVMDDHTQVGIAAACSIDEYDTDLIRKHERTRRDKEDDRTRHILTLRAQTGPVFLTYRADRRIDAIVESEFNNNEPLADFTAPDGIRHTIRRVAASDQLARAFCEVPLLYIADGHHRAASASRARAGLRGADANHTGKEDYNRFLAVIFPDDQMQILPYHRVVKDLNGLTEDEFLSRVRESFDVTPNGVAQTAKRGDIGMYLNGSWHTLGLKENLMPSDDSVSMLDVSLLQDFLLAPVLGIEDLRTDKRIDFVGGIRGTSELEKLVNEGKAAVAFALFPTTMDDLLRVSDANGIMPPKSTWFEPKLRDGLLIHCI